MKYFSPSYWFKLWVLSAPLFKDKTQGINAMSIDNNQDINKDLASNNTDLQSINQEISYIISSTNYKPYNLNQVPNQNINPIYQTEIETSTHKHRHEKSRKIIKRTTNIGVNGDNEIEFSGHFLGVSGKIYASFTPQFWEEIVYLKINYDKSKFEDKFKDKMYTGVWKDWRIDGGNVMKNIGAVIYDNFWTIANKFINSSRKKRIKIIIEKDYNSWEKKDKYEYKDSNIRTDDTRQYSNSYLDNLERDFPIWNSYKTFNLGIIDNDNNDFKNSIKQKFSKLEIEKISIVDKEEYSHFCQCFKAKLYVYNMNYYSFGNLRPTFSYITQTKLNEISNIIANDLNVKQWLTHINEWNSTLPQAINNSKTFTPQALYNWKRQEKEIIKGYIRDWSYVSTLIEHKLKLDELNKNVQGLKSSFDNIKNQMDELEKRVTDLEKPGSNCETIAWSASGFLGVVALFPIPGIKQVATVTSALAGGLAAICGVKGLS